MAKYYKDYTEEEKLRIVDDMINSNLTYKELMEKHSIGARSYKKLRDEYNIRKIAIRNKKFKVNDDYFEIIDTEEKAYWLGFFYADGCVSIDKNTNSGECCIKLSKCDYEHLKKFNKSIHGNIPVEYGTSICNLNNKEFSFCSISFCVVSLLKTEVNGSISDK